MKKKQEFDKESHPGNFPTRVLIYNLTSHFETVRKNTFEIIHEGVEKGRVNPEIQLEICKKPLKTPYINCDNKTIYLQENFIGYLWAMCYSLFVIFEEGVQKKILSNQFEGKIIFDTHLLQRAKSLLEWALTLKNNYSEWDLSLPNPERYDNEQEKFYAEKVNGIFQDVVVYDLFHEFSHLVNNHCEALEDIFGKKYSELTEEEVTRYKQIETEADNYAFDSIIIEEDSEIYKLHKGLAIILAHCTSLFIIKNPKSVKQPTHPDIDSRILNSIERLNLQNEYSLDYLWYFGSLTCKFFFDKQGIETDINPSDTTKDLFFRYLNEFDKLKVE